MLRYNSLKTDLTERGYECHLIPFEVGSRGYVSKSNRTNLMSVFLMKTKKGVLQRWKSMQYSKASTLRNSTRHTYILIWVNNGPRSTLFLIKNALNNRVGPFGST